MNIIARSILVFFILLTSSCNRKKETIPLNVIPVANTVGNYSILNISDFATEIKYIPLETNDSVLVGAIPRICYENGYLLVSEVLHNCYLFDTTGKFCWKIGQLGQVPLFCPLWRKPQRQSGDDKCRIVYATAGLSGNPKIITNWQDRNDEPSLWFLSGYSSLKPEQD